MDHLLLAISFILFCFLGVELVFIFTDVKTQGNEIKDLELRLQNLEDKIIKEFTFVFETIGKLENLQKPKSKKSK